MKAKIWRAAPAILMAVAIVFYIAATKYTVRYGLVACRNFEMQEKDIVPRVNELETQITVLEKHGPESLQQLVDLYNKLDWYGSVAQYDGPVYNDPQVAYVDYGDGGPMVWFRTIGLQCTLNELQKKYFPSQSDEQVYRSLIDQYRKSRARNWKLKPTEKTYIELQRNGFAALMLAGISVLWILKRHGWSLKGVLPPVALRVLGYFITFGITLISLPAVAAAQVVQRLKKQTAVAKVDSWADRNYEKQQLLSFDAPVGKRISLVALNQNRQSANGKSTLSYVGLGAKVAIATGFSVTAVVGPQIVSDAGRSASADSHVAFVNANYQSRTFSGLWLNRFQREHDGKNISAHRHVAAIRAGPLPSWLWLQTEVRRHKNHTADSFWGTNVLVGQMFSKKNPWLKGLYLYPYYDFGRHGFDIRVGWSKTFAFN